MDKKLILEDGSVWEGCGFGADRDVMAELVFNTSMVGYQEILSDPSYAGQAVVMTYPLIGNYGICEDDYESARPMASAMIVRECCDRPSNFRCCEDIDSMMKRYGIAGLSGVDTRKLTRHIRDHGSCRAVIVPQNADAEECLARLRSWEIPHDSVNTVSTKVIFNVGSEETEKNGEPDRETIISNRVSGNEIYIEQLSKLNNGNGAGCERFPDGKLRTGDKLHIAAIDCGMKQNILRKMSEKGCTVTVFPWDSSPEDILSVQPDGIFISNGPGDPEDVKETIDTVRALIGKKPVFGICLGHQIISLAYGARTYKLKFGHRGGNHPVKNIINGKVEITSQNHSYVVDRESLRKTGLMETHINLLDGTVEGVRSIRDKVMGIQYHPESAPGPEDSSGLFDDFIRMMKSERIH